MKKSKKLTAMILALGMALSMTACSTSNGATVPEGYYYDGFSGGSVTINGTSLDFDHVFLGKNVGYVNGPAYISNVWENISDHPAAGGYYWEANITCTKNNHPVYTTGRASKNGKKVQIRNIYSKK